MDPEERARREQRLSPQVAFVVQFIVGSDLHGGNVGGRVEHVASGRSARFASVEGLLRFFGDMLAQPGGDPSTD